MTRSPRKKATRSVAVSKKKVIKKGSGSTRKRRKPDLGVDDLDLGDRPRGTTRR